MGAQQQTILHVETPVGPARVSLLAPSSSAVGLLALGHGAGGGIEAVDLVAVAAAAVGAGWRVALVEQPWRVAGRRVAAPPKQLDVAWHAVVDHLRAFGGASSDAGLPLVLGGRSAGARVACRTAADAGAVGALCLAFPLHPPGRPERSRAEELNGAAVPVLVVQGRRDAFGGPDEVSRAVAGRPEIVVQAVEGDHGLKVEPAVVAAHAAAWLGALVGAEVAGARNVDASSGVTHRRQRR